MMSNLKKAVKSSFTFLFITACSSAYATEIGKTFIDFPRQDCDWNAGILLEDIPEYTVKVGTCEGRAEAWLSKSLPSAEGKDERVVIDHLRVGTMTNKLHFDWSMVCYIPGQPMSLDWFPILDHSRKRPLTHKNGGILTAWRVNAESKRFELVPLNLLKKAKCEYETEED